MDARTQHQHSHAFGMMNPYEREGLVIGSRRNMLKASLAGLCGLSFPDVLRHQAQARATNRPARRHRNKAVILVWMTGGPSQIDTWDPKPDRPLQNRGPFGVIQTRLPGVLFCEHLPKMASMLDRCTIIRSVDARHSNHEPNRVFQTGHLDAEPRLDPSALMSPGIGSVVAKYSGANRSGMPPYVAFQTSKTHVAHGGYLGRQYDPFIANRATALPILTDVGVDTGRKTHDLSYHAASGTWDNHGDNIPPYGGISKGLRPLLPLFDHLFTTLVADLDERSLLDDVLVIAMGEFGRTPVMGTQGSTDGRDHWAVVMSMALAGGGFRHGQVIGATEADGGYIKDRPVTPGDLAATIYHHMGVPLDATYTDGTGRPRFIVEQGKPIGELI